MLSVCVTLEIQFNNETYILNESLLSRHTTSVLISHLCLIHLGCVLQQRSHVALLLGGLYATVTTHICFSVLFRDTLCNWLYFIKFRHWTCTMKGLSCGTILGVNYRLYMTRRNNTSWKIPHAAVTIQSLIPTASQSLHSVNLPVDCTMWTLHCTRCFKQI